MQSSRIGAQGESRNTRWNDYKMIFRIMELEIAPLNMAVALKQQEWPGHGRCLIPAIELS